MEGEDARSIEAVLLENANRKTAISLDPFGQNLFSGAFKRSTEDGLNPNYVISPGDKIAVRIWGATTFDDLLTVDMHGNIFIPTVGPVMVGGVQNSELNATVIRAVRTVFTDNVSVYTSLNTAQPVAVFVTGYVRSPGRYGGIPSSSVLYFLDNAGGIDPERGSYREVDIIRNGKVLLSVDLYSFIMEGKLKTLQFQDGDTVFVSPKGRSVSVEGEVRNRNRFELEDKSYSGEQIMKLAVPDTVTTHVSVLGFRNGERFARYMLIDNFREFVVENGDIITFKSDITEEMIVVEIEGEFDGQSQYVLPKNTRLMELLDYIKVDPEEAQAGSISIRRESIAERQRTALHESLDRIESAYFTASSHTNEEASIRAQESQMISEFIKRARLIEPNGRLVLANHGEVQDVRLEMGDVITIPRKKESVMVNGEVRVSQAVLWDKGLNARDYISKSGGFTDQANSDTLLLVKQSGEVLRGDSFAIEPGDEIVVLPKVPVKSLQLASTISDILYKIAIAAKVAISL
ncbi:MAG: polysaccharide export protein [Gammaproteobacteria bacterium]|nr:polysaccharide export protein [Gammaproteobacteria bacterium]